MRPVNTNKHRWMVSQALPAVLLAVCYLCSIVGLDIHRDNEHGHIYVVSGIASHECESIHPGSHCHDSESEEACLEDESCCSDDFRAVTAPSEISEAQHVVPATANCCLVPVCQAAVPAFGGASPIFSANPPPPEPSAYLSKLCVLRV